MIVMKMLRQQSSAHNEQYCRQLAALHTVGIRQGAQQGRHGWYASPVTAP